MTGIFNQMAWTSDRVLELEDEIRMRIEVGTVRRCLELNVSRATPCDTDYVLRGSSSMCPEENV